MSDPQHKWRIERPKEEITLVTSLAPPGPEYREEDFIIRIVIRKDGQVHITMGPGSGFSCPDLAKLILALEEARIISTREFSDGV